MGVDVEDADEAELLFDSVLDDAAVSSEVALSVAGLKYERGFHRPDVNAAKEFAAVMCKRSREMSYDVLKHLLQPGVKSADVIAALENLGGKLYAGIDTEKLEMAHLKRILPMLDVRVTNIAPASCQDRHRVVSVDVNDAIIRLLQAAHYHRPQLHPRYPHSCYHPHHHCPHLHPRYLPPLPLPP